MADADGTQVTDSIMVHENDEKKLKHLDFIEVAAECGIVFLSGFYQFSKENSFLLKPGFFALEGIVGGIFGPLYEKYHRVPFEVLEFFDQKIDEFIYEVNWADIPVVGKAAALAHEFLSGIHRTGIPEAVLNIVMDTYYSCKAVVEAVFFKYEPVVEEYATWAWWWLNRLPIISHMAQKTVSNASFWAERYNQAAGLTTERGYGNLPVIPVEKISDVLNGTTADDLDHED